MVPRARGDGGSAADRVLVLNPASGSGDHADAVRSLATERGFDVRLTSDAESAVRFAADAAESGADLVAAAGGDGTINQVLRGLHRADGLNAVTLGVVPAGTGNNFAGNVGIRGIEHAFEVMDDGERRVIDVGIARSSVPDVAERPFINSCIAGLTAEASGDTSSSLKDRLGIVAYVLTTLRRLSEFDGVRLDVEVAGETAWRGKAILVLVGNGRRFPARGRTQANMEDGLFDVTVIEERPAIDLAEETAVERLFGGEPEHITRLSASSLELDVLDGGSAQFSLDGEMIASDDLDLTTRERTLRVCVGEEYEPDPVD